MEDRAVIIKTKDAYVVKLGKDDKFISSNSLELIQSILTAKGIPYTAE